ncbi:E3 ubiquitin-protein ligase RMA2-like [Typha latifolia]|uniref:E3 ubiquitin-protein ligase RMA2-like n=1 Tax=Typha latifolia TaxID=4733 RepID=UPI003C2B14C7
MEAEVPELNKQHSLNNCYDSKLSASSAAAYFDCNICLEFAVDPVITLCGHLYCWPCIYKWLQVDSTSSQRCPVCKAVISQNSLIPLYGRGLSSKVGSNRNPKIPSQPSLCTINEEAHTQPNMDAYLDVNPPMQQSRYHDYSHSHLHFCPYHTRGVIGLTAAANLPWVFRNLTMGELCNADPYHFAMGGERMRRRQRRIEEALNDLWLFLVVFIVVFLFFF